MWNIASEAAKAPSDGVESSSESTSDKKLKHKPTWQLESSPIWETFQLMVENIVETMLTVLLRLQGMGV